MPIQVIVENINGKELAACESFREAREFAYDNRLNVVKPIIGTDWVWSFKKKDAKGKCRFRIVPDSPVWDEDYHAWCISKTKNAFPSNHGTWYLDAKVQQKARSFVELRCNKDVTLRIKDDKVSLDYFVDFCYANSENKVGKEAIVEWNGHRCHLKAHTTPELAIEDAIRNLEHLQEIIDDPLNWDEHEIQTIYR